MLLLVGAGLAIVNRSNDYLLRANEYRSVGDVDRAPAGAPASRLSGGDLWRIDVPGLSLTRPALTDFGVGFAAGQNVIMVDRTTGATRWRYTRSDEPGRVSVGSTAGGEQVLAWWGSGAVYVLDARSGERIGQWSTTGATTSILDPALPVVARTGSDARTTIARVSSMGRDLWTYPLRACERARATLADAVVLLTVMTTCGSPSSRLIALDPKTGHELWPIEARGDVRAFDQDTVLVVTPAAAGEERSLTAINLDDGSTRWSQELPRMAGRRPCDDLQVQIGANTAVVVCTWDMTDYPLGLVDFSSTVHILDAATGSTVETSTYRPTPVVSTAVSTDGRVVAVRADSGGWMLEVISPSAQHARLRVAPYLDHNSTVRAMTVIGDQVLVVDEGSETVSSLR
jgi:outer membrane protein assembly factor BamB